MPSRRSTTSIERIEGFIEQQQHEHWEKKRKLHLTTTVRMQAQVKTQKLTSKATNLSD
jgi:hypothetical protein